MGKFYLRKLILVFAGFALAAGLHAQTFKLLKDINTQKNSNPSNAVNNSNAYAVINGKAYFTADDGVHGKELWVTDGTTAGTGLVIDINPGSASSLIDYIYAFKNKIYFFASKNSQYLQFWQSDGTEAGTKILKDSLAIDGAFEYYAASYAIMNDELFFTMQNQNNKDELWKTDGTGLQKIINLDSLPNNNGNNIDKSQ